MSEPNEENLGIDWLEKLIEQFKREPIFEGPQWNLILAELGRITVYFDILDFILKGLLVTLERPHDLTMDTNPYAQTRISDIIKKCRKALDNLEPALVAKHSKLIKDCGEQLAQCDKLRDRRNELIHALWSPSAFPPHSATRFRTTKAKTGENFEMISQGHDFQSLCAISLQIRNARYSLHALTMKFRVAFQTQRAKSSR
jgi:hypothetical protein